MDFPFQNCVVSAESLSVQQVRDILEYHHGMTYILLDLQRLEEELLKLAEQNIVTPYLSSLEQVYLKRLTSGKRKREWLGGRFAAKYVAAGVLTQNGNALPWANLAVIADKNGRPFLAAGEKGAGLPDISISHSGTLAAAMAVSSGLCGIDIQKVTDRVVKVRERFCSPNEAHIITSFFNASGAKKSSSLTKLWAAKEALRKVANMNSLPGFLELELTEINGGPSYKGPASWRFVFTWQHIDMHGNPAPQQCRVAVSQIADYALALTARSDTVD
jgi:phosphopantetheinyl transferase